ncbi:FAD-dependent 5-carboxymethylaminomethyl-2-thiouridine(34) oxidoreductase MnmC [Limnohabitans sp. Rim8]|uniref:FAD-dependent 5-carboxymethylaminomethyl-2-thiouridine(34) oxidoreductase MnmC n=1 Tax=Limnohabitans sp. Rim8 TaxID=1100718 RepID=UPI0033061AA6
MLTPTSPESRDRHIAVVGAGMAGAAVAASLAQLGWLVEVLDAAPALGAGASGLPVGLAAPHVSQDDNVLSRITRMGVQATLQRAALLTETGFLTPADWGLSGLFEHRVQGKRALPSTAALTSEEMRSSTRASPARTEAAGFSAPVPALWHSQAAWLRPRPFVAAQLATAGITLRLGCAVHHLSQSEGHWHAWDADGLLLTRTPQLVLASAYETQALLQALVVSDAGLPLHFSLTPLRGQVSFGAVAHLSEATRRSLPRFPVNGHGSLISGVAAPNDSAAHWFVGSTFERDCTHATVRTQDHAVNQTQLNTLLPHLAQGMAQGFSETHIQGWAGMRCTLPDRLPAVGALDPVRWPGLLVCTGMGARGISLSVLCGELIAAELEENALPLPPELAKHMAAKRLGPSSARTPSN